MNLLFESVDFNELRVNVYEKCENNEITESERNNLLESLACAEVDYESAMQDMMLYESEALGREASMMKYLGYAAGAIAAAGAMVAMGMKIASVLRTRKKIKESEQLTRINNDIKKSLTALKKVRNDLNKIIYQYKTDAKDASNRSDFYGTRTLVDTKIVYTNNGLESKQFKSKNMQYDRKKADEEKKNAEKLNEDVKKYVAKKIELKVEISKLKKLKSEFMSLVRSNVEETEYENIRAKVDEIMSKIEDESDTTNSLLNGYGY